MPITLNGNGTITGLVTGGLPDGSVDADTLAANAVTSGKILNANVTGVKLASGVGGKILQIVQSTDNAARSSTSTSYVDITGTDETGSGSIFECNITPASASSKILVSMQMRSSWSPDAGHLRVLRDSTAIHEGSYSATQKGFHGSYCGGTSTGETLHGVNTASMFFLDSPNTTSAIAYKPQWKCNNGTIVLNGSYAQLVNGADNQYSISSESNIVLMEIG